MTSYIAMGFMAGLLGAIASAFASGVAASYRLGRKAPIYPHSKLVRSRLAFFLRSWGHTFDTYVPLDMDRIAEQIRWAGDNSDGRFTLGQRLYVRKNDGRGGERLVRFRFIREHDSVAMAVAHGAMDIDPAQLMEVDRLVIKEKKPVPTKT
jgi:hypothetical protein